MFAFKCSSLDDSNHQEECRDLELFIQKGCMHNLNTAQMAKYLLEFSADKYYEAMEVLAINK